MIFSLGTLGRTVLSLFSDREMIFSGDFGGPHLVKDFDVAEASNCAAREKTFVVDRRGATSALGG